MHLLFLCPVRVKKGITCMACVNTEVVVWVDKCVPRPCMCLSVSASRNINLAIQNIYASPPPTHTHLPGNNRGPLAQ